LGMDDKEDAHHLKEGERKRMDENNYCNEKEG